MNLPKTMRRHEEDLGLGLDPDPYLHHYKEAAHILLDLRHENDLIPQSCQKYRMQNFLKG